MYLAVQSEKGAASVHWCLSKNANTQEPIGEPNKPHSTEFWGRKEAVQRLSRDVDWAGLDC